MFRIFPRPSRSRCVTAPVPALVLALSVSGAATPSALAAPEGEEAVVSTTLYGADLVKELGCKGTPLGVRTLVGAGSDPHSYSLLPADRARLARAKMVVSVHPSFERWLPAKEKAAGSAWIALAEGLPLAGMAEGEGHGHAGHSHEGAHGHGASAGAKGTADAKGGKRNAKGPAADLDPHVWLSPALTVAASERLAGILATTFPARAGEFIACQKAFAEKARALEAELKAKVEALPKASRVLATNHDAFGYFASSFGFEVLAVQGVSTESSPTPARLKRVIDGVRKRGVKALFLESSAPTRTMESVARETGVKVGGALHADGLGGPGSGAETTLALWRKNVETVLSALR